MTRNQKIALGCGGGGCLVILFVVVVCVVLAAAGYMTLPGLSSNSNDNYNSNDNANSNYNSNLNQNTNVGSSTSSSLSSDDKHKLFQAAGMTGDTELIQRVLRKLGFITESGAASDDYQDFVKEHSSWAMSNIKFVRSVSTAAKAREYVEAHIDD